MSTVLRCHVGINILGGYGHRPALASMEACADAAVAGVIV